MHNRQSSILATLCAMQGFLDGQPVTLASVNASGARQTLDTLAEGLAQQAVDQDAGRLIAVGETSLQESLRATLRLFHMKPIAAIAHGQLREVPEMCALKLPTAKTSSIRLVAMAGGMADAAAKHAELFIQRGLPTDFIGRLLSAADALKESLASRAASHGRSVGATAALGALETPARNSIRELDALVIPLIAHDDRLVGEWRTAKLVRRKPGRSNGDSSPPTPPTPTVAVEVAA